MAVDLDGNPFLAEFWDCRNRKVGTAGNITTIAGTGEPRSSGDAGVALDAAIDPPRAIAVDTGGNVSVTEAYGHHVWILRPAAQGSSLAVPLGTSGDSVLLTSGKDGTMRMDGAPLLSGTGITARNGNTYALEQTGNGIVVAT